MVVRLKALREAANLTQIEAAKRLGVSQSTISMWEIGSSKPRIDLLEKIANVYNCTVAQIFSEA